MDHIIRVSLVNMETPQAPVYHVKAVPYFLGKTGYPEVNPGDSVFWIFDPETVTKELQVVFSKVADLPPVGPPKPGYKCNPYGPFSSLELVVGGIVGKIRLDVTRPTRRRFYYQVFQDGTALPWYNPVPAAPQADVEGGIDIPMTPEEVAAS